MKVALHILRRIIEKDDDDSMSNKNYFSIQMFNKLAAYGMNYFNSKRFIDDIPYMENESGYKENMTMDIEQIETLTKSQISDCRFKAFRLNGFRMFPAGNKHWGLDIGLEKGKPCSLYLVGNNGSGKTSLYSGIEFYCTGKISAADFRCIKQENYDDYIGYAKKRGCTNLELMFVNEDLKSSKDALDGLNELLPAFFCSEHEINAFCNDANDLTNFLYQQVGYSNLVKIKRYLEEDLKTANEYKIENKEINAQEMLSYEEQIRILESIQIDIFDLIETSTLISKSFKEDLISYIDSFKDDKHNLNKYWVKANYAKHTVAIAKTLQDECDELKEFFSPQSQLIKLYEEFIDSVNTINSSEKMSLDGYVPRGVRMREQQFKMNLVDYKRFIAQKNYIWNYYQLVLQNVKDGKENESIIVSIRKIGNEIDVIKKRADSIQENPNLVLKRYKSHAQYLPALIEGIEEELKNLRKEIVDIVQKIDSEVLQDFLNPQYERLEFEEIGEKIVPTIYFKDVNGTDISFDPKEFFNSFRYKFFCVLLKITVAFTVKKYFKLNFPLIFDDIFYSSDFANRDKVNEFISSIYSIHNKIFTGDESPLQIIFFTHDDLILEAAIKGTSDFEDVVCGRLFPYNECNEESDHRKKENFEFYNLYIPFTNG